MMTVTVLEVLLCTVDRSSVASLQNVIKISFCSELVDLQNIDGRMLQFL